jgi:hypothetical protein
MNIGFLNRTETNLRYHGRYWHNAHGQYGAIGEVVEKAAFTGLEPPNDGDAHLVLRDRGTAGGNKGSERGDFVTLRHSRSEIDGSIKERVYDGSLGRQG